jgi:hypothetical protein
VTITFTPSGTLNISADPSELPEQSNGTDIVSGAMTRCKNLRLNQAGIAKTRDGTLKLNATAIGAPVWWIEEQGGTRYSFAGAGIYSDESIIEAALTSAQWSAIQYNAFNDTALNVFALNGTDRKRIEGGEVNEWGLEAPENAPTLSTGHGSGLTGQYRARYTYVRKVGSVVVAESNPSPASETIQLTDQSLAISFDQPDDDQVTHIRVYRTTAGGLTYSFDQEVPIDVEYGYGYCFTWEDGLGSGTVAPSSTTVEYGITFDWEGDDEYLTGGAYQFSLDDDTHLTQNVYTWEERYTESVSWDASVNDNSVSKFGTTSALTTASVTVTVTDPNGTPTYAWSKVSGDSISAVSASSASTAFRATGLGLDETRTATFQCVVSDAPNSETLTVTVTIRRNSSL